ncbi:HAD family hydrolase [Candidatus Gottesmanbacteria bacterium]|nr:HAD family hydrolase [Candidatus Gottesmanbacteria bacterium]
MFKDIRVLIWDFDGTFYKPNPQLWLSVREAEYRTIINHTGWSHEKTVEEFAKVYKTMYPSATEASAVLSGITIAQAAIEMEEYFDRRDFVKPDEKLIALFDKLKSFRHFILANGVVARHKETLIALGLSPDIFEEMVTSETVGVTKPHEAGFRYILDKTKLPAGEHLMIGDRETVDLVPAKSLGMKTCLVWADTPSVIADATLPTVYDIAKLLL